jgi:hypothetical protein
MLIVILQMMPTKIRHWREHVPRQVRHCHAFGLPAVSRAGAAFEQIEALPAKALVDAHISRQRFLNDRFARESGHPGPSNAVSGPLPLGPRFRGDGGISNRRRSFFPDACII